MAFKSTEFDFEVRLQQSLDAICRKRNGIQAIKVLNILSYFSSHDVPIDIFTTIMSTAELKTAIEHLKQFLLIDSSNKNNLINVNELVQKGVRALLRKAKNEIPILREAAELLLQIGKHSEKFDFVIDHGICVWLHMHNYDELLQKASALPRYIIACLIQQSKYEEANSFAWEALELLKTVMESDSTELLRLEFQFASLLQMSGKYKEAVRILMPLFLRNVKDLELKNGIFRCMISVMKKLQDMLQYEEVLPIYEKLLSDQITAKISNEETLTVWHYYAILLAKLEKYEDSVEILKEILGQRNYPLKSENILSIKTSIINVYLEGMQYSKALDICTELLTEKTDILKENQTDILKTKRNVISLLQKIGKYKEAIKMSKELISEYENTFDKDHPEISSIQTDLALAYYAQNEYQKAAEIFNVILKKQKEILIKTTNESSASMVSEKTCDVNYKGDFRVFNDAVMNKSKAELSNLTNVETMHSVVDSNLAQIYALIQGGFDINCKDSMGNTLLHYAAKSENICVIRLLLKFGSLYNAKNKEGKIPSQLTNNNDIKTLFSLVSKLFVHVKSGNIDEVSKCIEQERSIVNAKNNKGYHPLHWAASNGYTSILKILLEAGANPTHVSNKGNTPLHTAASKGFCRIAEVLLQSVKYDNLDDFINAQTYGTSTTALHVAAENKFMYIVRTLLRYGAIFSIKNIEGKTPLELSEDQTQANPLKILQELFQDAENGNSDIIQKLQNIILEEHPSIFNACNEQGRSLTQVLILNKHKRITYESLQILKAPYKLKPWESLEGKLKQNEGFKCFAKLQLEFSQTYIPMLQSLSNHCIPDTNSIPWKTVKEGSYFLGNAYNLVKCYQDYYPTTIYDANILQIRNVLKELQFESEHISSGYTEEAYGGRVKCFVSKGQGTKYYNILHSNFNKDVRYFIDLIEINIDIPTVRFLHLITVQLQSLYSNALFKAIQNKNLSDVEKYLKKNGTIVNLELKGLTPLSYCVEQGDIKIAKLLIENGADVTQKTVEGDTLLHIATSKRYKTIVELLLQYTPAHKLNNYINCRKLNGDTSLHIAAKNGYALIAKSLLKYRATYCLRNNKGKTPLDLAAKHYDTSHLLQLTHQCFQLAQNGNLELNKILHSAAAEELQAITNAQNEQGHTLLDIIERKWKKITSDKLLQTMDKYKRIEQHQPISYVKNTYEHYRKAARQFYENSDLYKSRLQYMSRHYPFDLQTNNSPWNILKEGSMYLYNAHRFVEECKLYSEYANNRNVLKIIKTLEELEFDPKHISWGHIDDKKIKSFNSLGNGALYYKMLSSNLKNDIEDFMYFVEKNIYDSVERFMIHVKSIM
ncbi:Tankyrase [Araneus ventricosus]|uniref:Tankyrase n=1 Tax=Araneus ventricosus TaxID=182803 RepID=A0A4Y2SHS7_ARAVE|nr:Tankyrase [Araneus ventricosus]GBN87792.1 Tankyrase [Araneus ventricosus]